MTATILVLVGLAINFGMLILGWLSLRGHQAELTRGQDEIHVMVNSNLSRALARGVQLTIELENAGIEVPEPEPSPGVAGDGSGDQGLLRARVAPATKVEP